MDKVEIGEEYTVLKSSLDKLVRDAANRIKDATGKQILVTEVEDVTQAEDRLKNANLAIVYQLTRFEESPRQPRYSVSFDVGVKTKDDNGNTMMTLLINSVKSLFAVDSRFELKDYSGDTAGDLTGALMITRSSTSPQAFDKQQSIRMISCSGAAVIYRGR